MSAQGGTVSQILSIAASGTVTIQPPAGQEWVIHNIAVAKSANLQVFDGTNTFTIFSYTGATLHTNLFIHITNSFYLKITDTSGSANTAWYNGVRII